MPMKNIFRQGAYFVVISGIGWCMDFGIYSLLSVYYGVAVAYANMLGALPAITFVFILATRHIFVQRDGGWSLKRKYAVYLLYQLCLIIGISFLAEEVFQTIYLFQSATSIFEIDTMKIMAKCMVTPLSMLMNFMVMKFLSEKI